MSMLDGLLIRNGFSYFCFGGGKILEDASASGGGHLQGTHVKISQLVTSLQTSRQKVVFARLVPSCQQVWNKLLTTCSKVIDIVRRVTICSNKAVTIMI